LAGGLFDALTDTNGEFFLASNEEGSAAAKLFEATEGNDIHPAAAIATASLINAVKEHRVEKDAIIMLNITGCGEERFKREHALFMLKPAVLFDFSPSLEEVRERITPLFA
jgi:cysteate synthase